MHPSQHIKPPSIDREKRGQVTLHPSRLVVCRLPPVSISSSRTRVVGNHGSTERVDIAAESDKDSEGRRKVRLTTALDDTLVGELKDTMVSNTKVALWTAQQVRQIKAIVSDTYKMDVKS